MNGYIDRYIAQGYSIFPCNPDKSPAISKGFLNASNDINIVSKQFYKDDLLIGLPTGKINSLLVLDFDVNKIIPGTNDVDIRTVDELIDHIKENYGDLPDTFSVETPSGGRHLYYLLPEDVEIRSGTRFIDKSLPVDIRCEGGYVVGPDDINYTVYDDVDELDIDNLQERCIVAPDWIAEIRKQKPEIEVIESQKENLPQSEILEIRSALAFLDSEDYETWYQVGMALKSTDSPSAKGLFHDWSSKSDKYDPAQTEQKWIKDLDSRDITIASLFHMAQKKGWVTTYQNQPALLTNPLEQKSEKPISPERLKEIQQKYEKPVFPKELLNPPGLIGDKIKFILRKSIYPQPIFAVSGAFCSTATLAGRKYKTDGNVRTNLYCLNVGSSSSGKEKARDIILELYEAAGCDNLCEVTDVSSDAAIETAIYENHSMLMMIDEAGMFLGDVTDKRAPAFLKKVTSVLMRLYTNAHKSYTCKSYADGDKKKKIINPNLCLLGTTVPENLYEKSLDYNSAVNGFLSRISIFESNDDILKKQRNVDTDEEPPVEIIDQIKALLKKPLNMEPDGNLDGFNLKPHIVKKSDKANELLDEFEDYIFDLRNDLKSKGKVHQIFGKTLETAEKYALLVAIGVNILDPIITEVEMEYGIKMSLYLSRHLQFLVENYIAKSEKEYELKKILQTIRTVGSISHEEITKKMQHLKNFDMNDILSTLQAQGRISQQPFGEGEHARMMITAK